MYQHSRLLYAGDCGVLATLVLGPAPRLLEDYGYIAEAGKEGDDDAVPQLIRDQPKFQKIMRMRKQLLSKVPKLKKQLRAMTVGIKVMHIELTQLQCQGKERNVKGESQCWR